MNHRDKLAEDASLVVTIDDGTEEGQGLTPQQRTCFKYGFIDGYDAGECSPKVTALVEALKKYAASGVRLESETAREALKQWEDGK